jgi:glycosyltransferase involved in cell wall biosynthesis
MRVLHFFKTYWPDTFGGVERTIHAIATGTAKYGIQSDVLSLSDKPKQNTQEFDGHTAYKAKLDFEFASTGFSREVFGRFLELSAQADIVHYHFPWPVMDVVHLTSRLKKPTVVTYHSDIIKQRILLHLYKPVMSRFLTSVDTIVATSPNYAATSPVLKLYTDKITIIPLGLNEADYPRSTEQLKAHWRKRFSRPFFIFVGVLRYYKGVHFLLEAAKHINADIAIIGAGPMEASLRAYSSDNNLANVHFLGAVSDADKSALLELSVGMTFPSHLRSEAFGLSLVEASMFGKPLISCEIETGTSFVNISGQTGWVVPPADASALANAMTDLLNDPTKAKSFGRASRDRYLSLFSAQRMGESYRDLYDTLLMEDNVR